MKVSKCEVMFDGLVALEIPVKAISNEQLAVIEELLPNMLPQFDRLLGQQALINSLATPAEVAASEAHAVDYKKSHKAPKPVIKDELAF